MSSFPDLPSFVAFLEARGELKRVRAPVSPLLEITEIALRSLALDGPAILFENVQGSPYPLAINLFASSRRVEWALGRPPAEWGRELAAFAQDMMPPRPDRLWGHRGLLTRALRMKPQTGAGSQPWIEETPDLDRLPVLQCWPEDGGRFFTLPLVITQSPGTGVRNVGMYRLQVHDAQTTGMHIQIERGGGVHLAEAEAAGRPLPVAVALGGDPVAILASVFPLPENIDELAFAGFVRGKPVRVTRLSNGILAPSDSEFVLEGEIPPGERLPEGPFGDHFGHYSHRAPFPVFHVRKLHRRPQPIYPATVVGRPPQEDRYMGEASQEMLLPLLKLMRPELSDLWAYFEAGFHNLAVASVRQRYPREAVKTALGLMGQGQMSLTKCLILVDPEVPVRKFPAVLEALRRHFDPKEDFLLLPGTAQDTLDFTSFTMNLGSKMILDATALGLGRPGAPAEGPREEPRHPAVSGWRNWGEALLAVRTEGDGREMVTTLVADPRLRGYRIIAAVSPDVRLEDDVDLLWGLFTRFDAARDIIPARASLRGAWMTVEGPLGVDATWKTGYPKPLAMDPAVVSRVSGRWTEYGL